MSSGSTSDEEVVARQSSRRRERVAARRVRSFPATRSVSTAGGATPAAATTASSSRDPDWRSASSIYTDECDDDDSSKQAATKALQRDPHFISLKKEGSVRLSRGIKDGRLRWALKVMATGDAATESSPLCKFGLTYRGEETLGKVVSLQAHDGLIT